MNVATIPAGGVAYAHIHVDFEVMLYILQGHVRHEFPAFRGEPATLQHPLLGGLQAEQGGVAGAAVEVTGGVAGAALEVVGGILGSVGDIFN